MEPTLSSEEVFEHFGTGLDTHVGRNHVKQVPVTDLVLGLRQHRHLVAQTRRARDPVSFGQPTHQLTVGMHLNERKHRLAIFVGHVVIRLNNAAVIKKFLEGRQVLPVSSLRLPLKIRGYRHGRSTPLRSPDRFSSML